MRGTVSAGTDKFNLTSEYNFRDTRAGSDEWLRLAKSAILVIGAARSGTSWLAKIFDSHPNILYRHEPDEVMPPVPGLDPAEQIRIWLRQRARRAADKRPVFRKAWRPPPLDATRETISAVIAASQRIPGLARIAQRAGVPDLVAPARWGTVRAAVKIVNWDPSHVARCMPETRCVFILRHPCGQVASVMAGFAKRQFDAMPKHPGAPQDLIAANWAERHGVDRRSFQALPEPARHAWAWRAFNDPAVEALRDLPNARIVIYEDLCRQPEHTARDLFAFAGLDWQSQTNDFLGTSTQLDRSNGYFDVFRSTSLIADRWRQTMKPPDQDAVRAVIATSSLCRFWPDLTPPAA
ncbi:sulfotransferase [Rhodopila sp.]|uniref:sulfotransferase n=1 Tax=Rhodopila sp. TaxID=2480087 RepID=UPI003D0CBA82